MKRTTSGLVSLVLSLSLTESASAGNKPQIECSPIDRVEYVVQNIPRHFTKVEEAVYLIEDVPESRNGYAKGGKLTVWLPRETYNSPNEVSVFDRTDKNPSKWYNVSNISNAEKSPAGCGDWGIGLVSVSNSLFSLRDSRSRFNDFINKVYDMIKEKENK